MPESSYALSDREFESFRSLVHKKSGIALPAGKKAFLVSRLAKRLRTLGLDSFQAYLDLVLNDESGDECVQMQDLISTNKTDFFREPVHFQFLRERVIPEAAGEKTLRIWSAASSTGEEPYSIAMTVLDALADAESWDCRILGSDLSTRVLERARSRCYPLEQVRKVPEDALKRHFLRGAGERAGQVKVKPRVAELVIFQRINLMDQSYPIKSPLNAVFCRNVMIYFDRPTQESLIGRLRRYIKPGGYLLLGTSEAPHWLREGFEHVAPAVYKKT